MVKGVVLLAAVVAAGLVYFVPFIVGKTRGVANIDGLFAVNRVLGWSVIGWVVAMVMALRAVEPSAVPTVPVSTLLASAPRGAPGGRR